MSAKPVRVPKYRHHKGSGQAFVRISGRNHYLGKHGTDESHEKYRRFIAELTAAPIPVAITPSGPEVNGLEVVELCAAYWRYAEEYYGAGSSSLHRVKAALHLLRQSYGRSRAADFGPTALLAIQAALTTKDHSRRYVNHLVQAVRRVFRWSASRELIPAATYTALTTVAGVRRGRTSAREPEPVKPVADPVIDATRPHLPGVVADMIDVQRLCGCRPGELVIMRPMDIDRRADVWEYRPAGHKGQWRDKERIIFLGPRCQELLTPYLLRPADAYLFVPKRKRKSMEPYTVGSYRAAIKTACEKAGVPRWTPLQLRHTAGTNVRRQYGLEAAQSTLGHSHASVTEIYAEKNHELAREVARKIG